MTVTFPGGDRMPSLREIIAAEIAAAGPIPFSRYMDLCLYHPELGYYSRAQEKFGKAGDFYTASDVHAVFGRLLARQFEEMWRALGSPPRLRIVELGPGRGLFARDVLDWSARKFPAFFEALRYTLVERSPGLRSRLYETLRAHVDRGKAEVADTAPAAAAHDTIVFANEFFDALPVEVFTPEGALRVALEGERLVERFAPPAAEEFNYLDHYSVRPQEGERVEAGLQAFLMMLQLAGSLQRGFMVAIDYGYTRQEQAAGRHLDTIMAYRRHTASVDPYEAPGEQDITAHVNFTALQSAAEQGGMTSLGLLTQSQFLLGIGEDSQFGDAFADCKLPQEQAKVALQLKHLVTPAGMGETFHVLLMSKGVEKEKAAHFSGLSFGRR